MKLNLKELLFFDEEKVAGTLMILFTSLATSGGRAGCGQVWRYHPRSNRLELFVESPHRSVLDFPDNITITPFGDLLLCEDGSNDGENSQFLVGVTPEGQIYPFGRNALNTDEFAGACFSHQMEKPYLSIFKILELRWRYGDLGLYDPRFNRS